MVTNYLDVVVVELGIMLMDLSLVMDTPLLAVAKVGYIFKDRGVVHAQRITLTVAATVS